MHNSHAKECNGDNDRLCRRDTVDKAVCILKNEKGYQAIKALGRGSYGDVFQMHDLNVKEDVAVKVVLSEDIGDTERKMWPKLQHLNIVPVIESFTLSSIDVTVFVMPVQKKSLYAVLKDRNFTEWGSCLSFLKVWLYDVLLGLEYIHSKNLCHLDLKSDNVLISSNNTAKICDFSFLNFIVKPVTRYDVGSPYIYRSPESCSSLQIDVNIDGVKFDMWTYGVMVVEVLTHFVLAKSVYSGKYWYEEVYPTLFNTLQEHKLKELMVKAMPACAEIDSEEVKTALQFINCFLRPRYKKRLNATQAKDHLFLNRNDTLGPSIDPIWIHKREKCYFLNMPCISLDVLEIFTDCHNIFNNDSSETPAECKSLASFPKSISTEQIQRDTDDEGIWADYIQKRRSKENTFTMISQYKDNPGTPISNPSKKENRIMVVDSEVLKINSPLEAIELGTISTEAYHAPTRCSQTEKRINDFPDYSHAIKYKKAIVRINELKEHIHHINEEMNMLKNSLVCEHCSDQVQKEVENNPTAEEEHKITMISVKKATVKETVAQHITGHLTVANKMSEGHITAEKFGDGPSSSNSFSNAPQINSSHTETKPRTVELNRLVNFLKWAEIRDEDIEKIRMKKKAPNRRLRFLQWIQTKYFTLKKMFSCTSQFNTE